MPIPDYRTLKPVKKTMPEVTEKDVNFLMEEAARNFAESKEVDRASQMGDEVVLDYSARDEDDVLQMAGKGDRFVLGSGALFPELDQALSNHKKGESITAQCKVPADHFLKPLQGKTLNFEASILEVNELNLPVMDDSLAVKVLGEGKTIVELRQVLTEELKFRREDRIAKDLINEFFDKLFEAVKGDVTEQQIAKELDALMETAYKAAETKGIKREDYDARLIASKIDPRVQLKGEAHRNVALRVALGEILKQPEFEVKDQELAAIFEAELADKTPEEQAKVRQELDSDPLHFAELRHRLQMQKLYEFIES